MAARTTLYGINNAVGARQNANLGLSSGDAMLSDKHFWIKPFGTWTEQDDRKGVSGYDAKTGGLVLGLDSSINDLTRLGIAFAYANTNVDSNSNVAPQSLDIDSYQLIGYGSYALDANTDLTFQADVGQNQNQGKRVITFTNSAADSDYDSYTAHLGAGVAHTYAIDDANRAIATVKADYTWIKDESYTESGAGLLNLDVESNITEALVAGVEGQLIHTLNPSTELNAKLGVGYDLINDQASITSSFAGAPGAQFTTEGLDPNPWIANAGFGLFHTADNGAEISANYDAEYRSDYLSQTASLKLRVAF
ncbi:Outer membrane autotransporter barrel [Marinobacterium lacunae]|uniref:Outer membrane autotransporter barrel n=2 Tax=Marinobacterium lacunae TaxID=1232683 RepID=A0A081FZ21_9GAMM|nr:Outer membrane autotransporter barrel [Marinobacterium lacunae]